VADTGIGIPLDRVANLFNAFAQADESIARQFGGTGLGLVISRDLARLMGGDVLLDSSPGKGTTVTLDLPLKIAIEESAAHAPSQTRGAEVLDGSSDSIEGLRVLVVDDNAMNLKVLERSLSRAGMTVHVASSADRGLDVLGTQEIDLVLMDLYMPEINGAEATRTIRATPHLAHLPVLAVSASVTAQEREECRLAGMDGFVSKPVRLEVLLAEIKRVVGTRSAPAEPRLPSRDGDERNSKAHGARG
jgi:CheY-like chemotaxis protein